MQARAVATAFAANAKRGNVTVWACSILPEHVHMVIGRHHCPVEKIVGLFKAEATKQLLAEGLHPFGECPDGPVPTCWTKRAWKVYLDSVKDIQRSIDYVEKNALKEGKPTQHWSFVTPFDANLLGVV